MPHTWMPETARLCPGASERMWAVHQYPTATCSLKLMLKRVMLTKSNTAQEEKAITPTLRERQKADVTPHMALHYVLPKR